jgi:hypothetical protein
MGKPSGVEAAKPSTEPRTNAPVDLRSIEKLIYSLDKVSEINKSLVRVQKELNAMALYAKIFVGLGAVGVLILLRYALWVMRVF